MKPSGRYEHPEGLVTHNQYQSPVTSVLLLVLGDNPARLSPECIHSKAEHYGSSGADRPVNSYGDSNRTSRKGAEDLR